MSGDFLNLKPEDRVIVLVDTEVTMDAESLVRFCEHCGPDVAVLPFDIIVDLLSESDPAVTDYVLERPEPVLVAGMRLSRRRSWLSNPAPDRLLSEKPSH